MSRFTPEEFDIAFGEVYPSVYPFTENCKKFLEFLLTNTPENVSSGISLSIGDDMVKMKECLNTIIDHDNIEDLMGIITFINNTDTTIEAISKMLSGYEDLPIVKVCLQMFQNRELELQQAPPPPSARFDPNSLHEKNLRRRRPKAASVEPSARPPASATTKPASAIAKLPSARFDPNSLHEKNLRRRRPKAASVDPGSAHPRSRIFSGYHHGGSRRRRTSHRKRKSYRKSKCVRHTRRKQTRRHRHRRSRHRR